MCRVRWPLCVASILFAVCSQAVARSRVNRDSNEENPAVFRDMIIDEEGPFAGYVIDTYNVSDLHPSYMGCYKPAVEEVGLPHTMPAELGPVSVKPCRKYCREQGYTFAGLQSGSTCLCGNEYFSEPSKNCHNMNIARCEGNDFDVCGGSGDATSVYRVCDPGKYPEESSPNACTQDCSSCDNGCDAKGACIPGCGVGRRSEGGVCVDGCPVTKYGVDCSLENLNCLNDKVHPINGYCVDACKSAEFVSIFCFSGVPSSPNNPNPLICPICRQCINRVCYGTAQSVYFGCPATWEDRGCEECMVGYWGKRCNFPCVANCQACSKSQGQCLSCVTGRYGDSCQFTCPVKCKYNTCHPAYGTCTQGCSNPDLGGDRCETCAMGRYGDGCSSACPDNCNGGVCDATDGYCFDGCLDGFWDVLCDKACSENCEGEKCGQHDGACTACAEGYYGVKCDSICLNCQSGACFKDTGICVIGCFASKYGDLCDRDCPKTCNLTTCERGSGICLYGCVKGYQGQFCNQVYDIAADDDDNEEGRQAMSIGEGVGIGIGAIAAVCLAFLLLLLLLKRQKKEKKRHIQVYSSEVVYKQTPQGAPPSDQRGAQQHGAQQQAPDGNVPRVESSGIPRVA